jgi:Kef-type K+ transport system membrane component KefB
MLFFMAGYEIPLFFVETGVSYDLNALTAHATSILLLPLFLVLFLVCRGIPCYFTAPPGSTPADRRAIALYASTALPLVVAITSIGVDRGTLKSSTAAAMVGAGMLSVLVYPLLALQQSGSRVTGTVEEAQEAW